MINHWRYFKYVCRHKWFVFRAGLKTHAPIWRLIIHDYTKFMPAEWNGYVHRFFSGRAGVIDKESDPLEFHKAWTHHWHRNPHHWEYWLRLMRDNDVQPMPMPEKFVREMVADWMGASRAITGEWDIQEWWDNNKHRIYLHEETEQWLLLILVNIGVKP